MLYLKVYPAKSSSPPSPESKVFDNVLDFSEYELGQVIRVMEDTDKFIIKLNDGSLLVNEYECDTKIEQGVILQ